MPILKKLIANLDKQRVASFIAKRKAMLIKTLAVSLFALILLTMLPAAMPDTHADQLDETTRFDEGIEYPVPETTPEPIPDAGLVVVYSARDEWGLKEAELLCTLLKKKTGANSIILTDSEYNSTTDYFDNSIVLTVSIGVTSLIEDTYFDVLSRLGADGLEISDSAGRIDVVSASPERVREAIEAISESISYDGEYNIDQTIFRTDARPTELSRITPTITVDGDAKILVFSHVDSNEYTLRALEGIVANTEPDLVIFNGEIDGGASTRSELSDIWETISEMLKKTSTPWYFTPGEINGKLSRITICEVISSFDGCIKPVDGDESAQNIIHIADTDGRITSSIYIADTYGSSDELCTRIEFESAAFARATDYKRAVCAVLPALPKQLCLASDNLPDSYISDKLTDLFDSLKKAGAEIFISAADSVTPAIEKTSAGTSVLCGSIGFDTLGLGGRFDYNNSLRGGVLLSLSLRRADYTDAEVKYIYAADLGLTKR